MLEQPISGLPTANPRQFKVGKGKLSSNWTASHWGGGIEADGYFLGDRGLKLRPGEAHSQNKVSPKKQRGPGPRPPALKGFEAHPASPTSNTIKVDCSNSSCLCEA